MQSFQEVEALLLLYDPMFVSDEQRMKKSDPPWDVTKVCVSASGQSSAEGLTSGRTLVELLAATDEEVVLLA